MNSGLDGSGGQSLGWGGVVNIEYNMLGGSSLLPETEQGDPEQ